MNLVFNLVRLGLVLGALGVALLSLLAFLGFAVPMLDLLNHGQIFLFAGTLIGLVLVLACAGSWRLHTGLFVALGLVASGSVMVPEFVGAMTPRPAVMAGSTPIRMMTHNLFGMNYAMARVTQAILGEDPDIIVFQEYFGEQANDLHPLLIEHYPYFARCRGGKRANLGLYSRLPFTQVNDGMCPDTAYSTDRTAHILAQFETPEGKSFSVLTTHMDWPFPLERQRTQLAALRDEVNAIEGPLIVAGDFNSTPWSYALRNFVGAAGLKRETTNLATYPMRWFYRSAWRDTIPFLPLDHVMSKGIVVHELHAGTRTASDHLPVVFSFTVE